LILTTGQPTILWLVTGALTTVTNMFTTFFYGKGSHVFHIPGGYQTIGHVNGLSQWCHLEGRGAGSGEIDIRAVCCKRPMIPDLFSCSLTQPRLSDFFDSRARQTPWWVRSRP
jgi:hypothetical protein